MRMFLKSLITIGALSLSTIAAADKLTLINDTNEPSTSYINKTACSSHMEHGTTYPGGEATKNTIDDKIIAGACLGSWSDCLAVVYMTPDCGNSGNPVAIAHLKIERFSFKGVQSIQMLDPKYSLDFKSPFEIRMYYTPA